MSLEAQYNEIPEPPKTYCRTCNWYAKLSPEDKAFFDQKACDPNTHKPRLWAACRANGLQISAKSFREHLRNAGETHYTHSPDAIA